MRPHLLVAALMLPAVILPAPAVAEARLFSDSRERFQMTLPQGWELTPRPGDTEGMWFRRKGKTLPANVSVKVGAITASDTHASVMEARTRMFQAEIGYEKVVEAEVRLGELRMLRRVHTMHINGDQDIRLYSVDHVLFAYGHAHYIHLETRDGLYPEFSRDLDAMLRSYVPLAGRALYAPVIGRWQLGGANAMELSLGVDQTFTLGAQRNGLYRVDGRRLTFQEPLGTETWKYTVQDDALTLSSEGRDQLAFRRALGGPVAGEGESEEKNAKARRALKITREMLVGAWMVVEGGDSFEMVLSDGGAMRFGPMNGRYTVNGNLLTIESVTGVRITYHVSFDGKRIRMTGGDLDRPLILERRQ